MQTINVYLDAEKLKALPGFTSTKRYHNDNVYEEHTLPDSIKLTSDKGRWYIILSDGDMVPNVLKELVTEVSVREWIIGLPTREAGVYEHESAEAEVDYGYPDEKVSNKYQIKVLAKKLNDALELIRRIKVGNIRPTESFEVAQGGKSRAELEAELARLIRERNEAEEQCSHLLKETADAAEDRRLILALRDTLFGIWPWCSKGRVIVGINDIVNRNDPTYTNKGSNSDS